MAPIKKNKQEGESPSSMSRRTGETSYFPRGKGYPFNRRDTLVPCAGGRGGGPRAEVDAQKGPFAWILVQKTSVLRITGKLARGDGRKGGKGLSVGGEREKLILVPPLKNGDSARPEA